MAPLGQVVVLFHSNFLKRLLSSTMSLLTVLINISSSTYAFTNEEGETKEMYVPKAAYVMDNLVLFDKAT